MIHLLGGGIVGTAYVSLAGNRLWLCGGWAMDADMEKLILRMPPLMRA
jgi:hypothetical protein